jgi:hypothetical protein
MLLCLICEYGCIGTQVCVCTHLKLKVKCNEVIMYVLFIM